MKTISWLHLSDLHLKLSDSYNQSRLLTALLADVDEQFRRHNASPDFVVLTGDLAFSGQPEEYGIASQFLDELLARVALDRSRLFLVPGNHDINRLLLTDRGGRLINGWPSRDAINNLLFGNECEHTLAGLRSYFDFFQNYLGPDIVNDRGFYCRSFDLANRTIAILGLNSAFACRGDDDRYNLFIGERQVIEALNQSRAAQIRIALYHHPLDWLHENDRNDVESILLDRCDFLLHGHMHRLSLQRLSNPDSSAMVIAAGATYQGRTSPNVYNIASLDLTTNTGQIILRRYSDERGGFWSADTLTYRNTPHGICHFRWPVASPVPETGWDSQRLVSRYPKVFNTFLNEDAIGSRTLDTLLISVDDPGGIDIIWRSPELRQDLSLRVKQNVRCGELARALAREYFAQEFVVKHWYLRGADFERFDSNRMIREVVNQGSKLVYLSSIPLEAERLHSPSTRPFWSVQRIAEFAERDPLCLRVSSRYVGLRKKLARRDTSIRDRLTLRLLRSTLWVLRRSLNDYGWVYGEVGNLESGVQILEALESFPRLRFSVPYADTMAWLYYRQRRFWKARCVLLGALEHELKRQPLWTSHLYFIFKGCGEDGLAAKLRSWFLANTSGTDELTALAYARVAFDDDSLDPRAHEHSARDTVARSRPDT